MKYYIVEVQRTYNTEVIVKCKDEKTVQRILDATPDRRDDWDAQINLWDYILDEEMQQCDVQNQVATITREEINPDEHLDYFDLDEQIIEDDA